MLGNRLLAKLPVKDRQRFLDNCECIQHTFATVLCEPGEPFRYAHFPVSGFISLISAVDGVAGLEVGLIGSEGMLGVPLVLGVGVTTLRATVQGAGAVLRISAAAFQKELVLSAALRRKLYRYVHVLLAQFAQTAACTRFHSLDARLARWLLTTQDRAQSSEFHLTHEILAHMLGVRRVGVTNAASEFQRRGLLSYSRGEIKVLDRAALIKASCGCYQIAEQTYEQTLR